MIKVLQTRIRIWNNLILTKKIQKFLCILKIKNHSILLMLKTDSYFSNSLRKVGDIFARTSVVKLEALGKS